MVKDSVKPQLRQMINSIKKEYNIRTVRIKSIKHCGGYATEKGEVFVDKDAWNTVSQVLSTVFHEIGHVYCFRNKIWWGYHGFHRSHAKNKKKKRALLATAFKAEQWVDKWAEKEMKKHFPDRNYYQSYRTERDRDWLMDYLRKEYLK